MTRRVGLLSAVLVPVILMGIAPSHAQEHRGYKWFLRQVNDLDRLPYLNDADVVSRQFSSYHRASRYNRETGECEGMDVNGDAGHRLSVHFGPEAHAELVSFGIPKETPRHRFGDLEWVLDPLERDHVFFLPAPGVAEPKTAPPQGMVAAIGGPGCILRIWSADPRGKIRFYFDGNTEPLEFDFRELFLKGTRGPTAEDMLRCAEWPFIRPLVFRRPGDGDQLASNCYVPIPFSQSCIVTLTEPSFYHVGYKQYPDGVQVATFRLPLNDGEASTLRRVCRALTARGVDPRGEVPGRQTIDRTVDLPPGRPVVLAELAGPGIVQALHAKLTGGERYAHSKVLLTAYLDDEPEPSIWSPLVNFFGTGFEPKPYRSYPLGYIGEEGYCYYPMPFFSGARFVMENQGSRPATLSYRIAHVAAEELPMETMHFKAKYRREQVSRTFDYPLLQATGAGRFLGASLCIDDAWRSWWGEGDEKIWVDDDVFPSFFGTGSEDYFGDAWGIRTLQESFYACSFTESTPAYSRSCCYRWMVPDDVPFRKGLLATIENYPETIWGTEAVEWDEDYVSVAYWYQRPGGADFFRPVPVSERRPWGKVPSPPVVEAEAAMAAEFAAGAALLDDEDLDYEFSRGLAIDLGEKRPGDEVSFDGPELIVTGAYAIDVHTPRAVEGPAAFEVLLGEEKLGQSPEDPGRGDVHRVGMGVFEPGRPRLTFRFTSAGSAVFDAIELKPARQLRDVAEAEKTTVISARPSTTTDTGVLWSGGRQLRLPATGIGDLVELEVNVPRGQWHLCIGQTRGPAYGDYRAEGPGGASVLLRGYSERDEVADWVRVGVSRGEGGPARIRLQCTGKHDRATGYALGIDYIGWQRIVVEGALEGESATIVDITHGRRTDQLVGDRFSGGNHLWFHPTQPEGSGFTWLLEVPEDGRYELAAYFTKSWDYAIVRLSLNGRELGTFDTYAPTVEWGGKTPLGEFDLKAGEHRLRFDIAGRNELSSGILVGVDCLTLLPVE